MPLIASRPENLASLIYMIRGEKVLLSEHLAELYGVPVKVLNQGVKRNIERFPNDFMFQLNRDEADARRRSRSQIVTLKRGENLKYLPYAFTEQGVAMLSSLLRREVGRARVSGTSAAPRTPRSVSSHDSGIASTRVQRQRANGENVRIKTMNTSLRLQLRSARQMTKIAAESQ